MKKLLKKIPQNQYKILKRNGLEFKTDEFLIQNKYNSIKSNNFTCSEFELNSISDHQIEEIFIQIFDILDIKKKNIIMHCELV